MMGHQGDGQDRLFHSFNLDEHIPQGHLLRGINQFLDLSELHQHLADYYSHTGRPSIDPELMIRMLVIGYCFGIRSERRLCEKIVSTPSFSTQEVETVRSPYPDSRRSRNGKAVAQYSRYVQYEAHSICSMIESNPGRPLFQDRGPRLPWCAHDL